MTLEELADLIRANGASTNGRIDGLRNESNAALMNTQNDLTDVRSDLAEVRRSLDLAPVHDAAPDRRPHRRGGRPEAPHLVIPPAALR